MKPWLKCNLLLCATIAVLPVAAQQQTVTCSAQERVQTCQADTSRGVLLLHERSEHRCTLGKSWHYDSKGIHVSRGCSADFLVNPRRNNAFGEGGYRIDGTGVDARHTNAIHPDRQ